MSFKKLSIQTKFIIPILTLSILFIVGSLIYFGVVQKKQEQRVFKDIEESMKTKVELSLAKKGDVWITNALQIAINQDLSKAVAEKNRKEIDSIIGNIGKIFKQDTSFKNVNIQIVDSELNNLYRSWNVDKHGDSERYSDIFSKVLSSKKPIISIEESTKGLRLKGVYPVIYDGKVVGALNFEGGINSLAKDFKKEGIDFLYFLAPEYKTMLSKELKEKDGYLLNSSSYIDEAFLNHIMSSSFSLSEAIKKGYLYDSKYFIVPVELKDFMGERIGIALMAYHHDYIEGIIGTSKSIIISSSILMIVTVLSILGVVVSMLIFYVSKPLTRSIKEIKDASAQITSASNQVASASTNLAESSSTQASSVEEINATVQNNSELLKTTVQNSQEANNIAQRANSAAMKGNKNIEEMIASMQHISESSSKISKIIHSIDEIAFQTNLLALNAAVEAARAGEHGLGFAVVADEVKNLAQRSANSAKETTEIIDETLAQISNGEKVTKASSESFKEILESIKKTSAIIADIKTAIESQSEGMDEINQAISEIDSSTQSNAASSEEAAASSEELNAQALSMLESVEGIAHMLGLKSNFDTTLTSR
jgi:methyl-accepting chemotaxis protein